MSSKINQYELNKRLREAAMRGVIAATEAIKAEAVRLILSPPKTGRVYRKGGVKHQASAPGEAPASNTGFLANSIITEYDLGTLTGRVIVKAPYGMYLEYGTQTIEPRPFLRPALASRRRQTRQLISDELQRELKK